MKTPVPCVHFQDRLWCDLCKHQDFGANAAALKSVLEAPQQRRPAMSVPVPARTVPVPSTDDFDNYRTPYVSNSLTYTVQVPRVRYQHNEVVTTPAPAPVTVGRHHWEVSPYREYTYLGLR